MKYPEESNQLADEYYDEGHRALDESRLDEAALLVQNAIQLYKKCENYEKYTMSMNLMGVIYAAIGNEAMAIDYYLEGLECAIDHQFRNLTTLFYNNIGTRYQELNEHEKAIDYFGKAVQELDNPACKKEPRHGIWCFVTYLNLLTSYRELQKYDMALKYLKLAEESFTEEMQPIYRCTFMVSKCRLLWKMGEQNYVYDHLNELLESAEHDQNASDYVQDIRDLCALLRDMREYDSWKRVIDSFERYANEQGSVYFKLILTEMLMEYYRIIGEMKMYIHLCVDHTELYQKQKEITDKERAAAIDIKIELRNKEVERKQAEVKSTTDALTGLGNRYLLDEEAKKVIDMAAKEQKKIAVGLLDIDYFKQHNDTYGHIQGDVCLQQVAKILSETVKDVGQVYRFGGDEFVMILLLDKNHEIEQIAYEVKMRLMEEKIANIHSKVSPNITISQGYACLVPGVSQNIEQLIEHADEALYYVKMNGRNGYHIVSEK